MQTIYLEPDEEITSVIEKLREAEDDDLRFVVPRGATLLQSVVNLKLLKKKADSLDRSVAIVTTDKIGRNLAEQVGLPTLARPDDKQSEATAAKIKKVEKTETASGVTVHRYDAENLDDEEEEVSETERHPDEVTSPSERDSEGLSQDDEAEEPAEPEAEEGPEEPKPEVRIPGSLRRTPIGNSKRGIKIALALLVAIGAAAGFLVFYPHATATVFVKGDPYVGKFDLTVDAKAPTDVAKTVLAGKALSSEATITKSDKPTGKKDIGEKAKGTITVNNGWSSDPQPLVSGTRFASSDGKIFKTTADVTIPGASATIVNGQPQLKAGVGTVAVEADQPGDSYNVPAGKFTIPGLPADKQAKIYGQASSAMSGGISKQLTVIAQADLDNLTNQAKTEAVDRIKADLATQAGQDTILPEATETSVKDTKLSGKMGDEASSVSATVTIKARAISYAPAALRTLAADLATAKAPEGRLVSVPTDANPKLTVTKADYDGGKLETSVSVDGQSIPKIDTEKIRQGLTGKAPAQVKQAAEGQPVEDISVELRPSWYKRLPYITRQITVKVESK